MFHTSTNAIEFQDRYSTEDACIQALIKLRWPKGFVCPNCGHDDAYFLSARRLYQCTVCRHQASITSGTIFHKSRIPLRHWFWMIFLMAQDKGGTSASRLAKQLGMYQKTVWHMLHKIRHAMGSRDSGISLAGLIEMDPAIIGPHARKTGRQKTTENSEDGDRRVGKLQLGARPKKGKKKKRQTPVLVLVEALNFEAGNLVMQVLDTPSYESIGEVVEQKVDEGRWQFKSDGAQYNWVVQHMGHELDLKVCQGNESLEHLPILNQVVGLLKRFLFGTYHGVSAHYLPSYLQEFCFRFNRRLNEEWIFESMLRACLFTVPMTCAELKL